MLKVFIIVSNYSNVKKLHCHCRCVNFTLLQHQYHHTFHSLLAKCHGFVGSILNLIELFIGDREKLLACGHAWPSKTKSITSTTIMALWRFDSISRTYVEFGMMIGIKSAVPTMITLKIYCSIYKKVVEISWIFLCWTAFVETDWEALRSIRTNKDGFQKESIITKIESLSAAMPLALRNAPSWCTKSGTGWDYLTPSMETAAMEKIEKMILWKIHHNI